ncbi:RNA polymerase sigma-70 factor (ECF subfamily) [Asanoa ferruginea]|uniref:RNA polymerase sigma-70 factor (ECF subfamily) n=2 Tax=Asanoa ferruginea TaxID=53367 RepID=A0A3D9ZR11_9ACTN|nr:RNA polymerase sigma-70 factor (ECF subfamily) [Asanoa ferruginea]GIF51834.1 RNA polymerase sigma24 factor [Asanoa ferruginea]
MTLVMTAAAAAGGASATYDQVDFDDFYAAKFDVLRSQLYAYLGDRAEAQDLVQEAFCRAYSRWAKIRKYDDPYAWVRRVAWNLATSRLRRQKTFTTFLRRQREEHHDGPSPDRVALVAALAKIPPKLRRAVVLHYLGQLSVAEIAAQEEVPEGTVKSWLSRGRTALAEHLTDDRKGESHV